MRERPILFNGPMVRAILEGRKTVTRRIVKPQPPARNDMVNAAYCGHPNLWLPNGSIGADTPREWKCPYGQPGDRLWVRETHRPAVVHSCAMDACDCGDVNVEYRADGEIKYFSDYTINEASPDWSLPRAAQRDKFVPAIHMSRWASRITLEVTGVRVERVQDISEADSRAEGAESAFASAAFSARYGALTGQQHRYGFAELWESINGPGSWGANPWVWAVDLKRVTP